MTKSEQKFANILGKLVVTIRERDSMGVGCIGICVAVAPSLANLTYNVIVKHIDFVKDSNMCTILHSVVWVNSVSKYTWIAGEENNRREDWFYSYNINDLTILTN